MYFCINCADEVNPRRFQLGYRTCLPCGEREAKQYKHTIVPLHKSNYIPVFNRQDLVGINSKGGGVRNLT